MEQIFPPFPVGVRDSYLYNTTKKMMYINALRVELKAASA